MSKSLNRVELIGRLGKDPELKTVGELSVCNMTLATSESWKNKSGNVQEATEWHRIVVWNKLAEICGEHLKKGSRVYFEGKLQTRSYETNDTIRVTKYVTEIKADKMIMLDNKKGEQGGFAESTPKPVNHQSDGDIPF